MQFEVKVSLRSNTPVVGCEINPFVHVNCHGSGQAPPHTLNFTWYREHGTLHADQALNQAFGLVLGELSNYLPEFGNGLSLDHNLVEVEREGKTWIQLCSLRTYVPSLDDLGLTLRLECIPTDNSTGAHLSPVNVVLTDPVIRSPSPCPRCMISVGSAMNFGNLSTETQSLSGGTFTVLSYNILADLYASRNAHRYTPAWALTWEYRRQNLLNEIIGYNADILCLQEVQSDHFDTFLKPEMAKCGYSAVYKKKTKEVYTGNQYIIDGCAIFFRHDKFKEIVKYELEFDRTPLSVVEMLEPYQRNEVCFRLMKGNIAIVLILESIENDRVHDDVKSRICVANTHIHADSSFPDAKLFQVVNFIKGLEKISDSHIPLLICGDMNSLPRSDPHKFVVDGKVRRVYNKFRDPLGIYKHLELFHSMHLASAYSSFFQSKSVKRRHMKKMDRDTREPQFTNFGSGRSRTLDYIFYTENSLVVDGLLELLDEKSIGGTALPSTIWSSDHVALMASFSYKKGFRSQQFSTPPPNPWEGKTPGLKILLMEEDGEYS